MRLLPNQDKHSLQERTPRNEQGQWLEMVSAVAAAAGRDLLSVHPPQGKPKSNSQVHTPQTTPHPHPIVHSVWEDKKVHLRLFLAGLELDKFVLLFQLVRRQDRLHSVWMWGQSHDSNFNSGFHMLAGLGFESCTSMALRDLGH